MIDLIDNEGHKYSAPDQTAADNAVSSGQFQYANAPQQTNVPPPPDQNAEMMERAEQTAAPPPPLDLAQKLGAAPPPPPPPTQSAYNEPTLQLVNQQTGQEEQVPESKASTLIARGTHTTTDVPLIDAEGNLYNAPNAEAITNAIQSGKFRLSTLQERKENQEEQNYRQQGIGSPLGSFVAGVTIPLIKPIVQNLDAQDVPELETIQRVAQKSHPGIFGAGRVVEALGGEGRALGAAGEAASTATGVKGLSKIVLEGAVYAAPQIADKVLEGDGGEAAAEALKGATLNLVLHGALVGGAAAVKGASSLLESTKPVLADYENAFKESLNLSEEDFQKVKPYLGAYIEKSGLAEAKSDEEILQKIKEFRENPEVEASLKKLDTLQTKDFGEAERSSIIDAAASRSQAAIEKLLPEEIVARHALEQKIIDARSELEAADPTSDRVPLRNKLGQAQDNLKALAPPSVEAAATQKMIEPVLQQLEKTASFADLENVKQGLIHDTEGSPQLRQKIIDEVGNAIETAQNEVATKLQNPGIITALREARGLDLTRNVIAEAAAKYQVPEEEGANISPRGALSLARAVLHAHPTVAAGTAAFNIAKSIRSNFLAKNILARAIGGISSTSSAPMTDLGLQLLQYQDKSIANATSDFFDNLKPIKAATVSAALSPYLPNNGTGQTHTQQVATLRQAINQNLGNPQIFTDNIASVVGALHAEGLNKVADAYTQHQLRVMKVIQAVLPKDPTMQNEHPFAAKVDEKDIDPAVKQRYERVLTIANDPLKLLDLIKSNQITSGDVAIAAATNPIALGKMRQALVQEAIKSKPDLSLQQRLSIGILMGQNIDESTQQLQVLQSVYVPPAPSGTSGTPKGGSKISAKSAQSEKDINLTTSQLAAGHT